MVNLIVAYLLIAIVLIGYGLTLWRRGREVEQSIRLLEDQD